jgi:hypothetical protein
VPGAKSVVPAEEVSAVEVIATGADVGAAVDETADMLAAPLTTAIVDAFAEVLRPADRPNVAAAAAPAPLKMSAAIHGFFIPISWRDASRLPG